MLTLHHQQVMILKDCADVGWVVRLCFSYLPYWVQAYAYAHASPNIS